MKQKTIKIIGIVLACICIIGLSSCDDKDDTDKNDDTVQTIDWNYARCTLEIPQSWDFYIRADDEIKFTVNHDNEPELIDWFYISVTKTGVNNFLM